MENQFFNSELMFLGLAGFILLLVWSFIWKGWALWVSARQGSKVWFIVLLIVNTIGILEILYIFVFSKKIKNSETLENKIKNLQ